MMHKLGYLLLEYTVGLTFAALVLQNLLFDRLKSWAVGRQGQHKL